MAHSTSVLWNSLTSGARQALSVAVVFVMTPIIIRGVGADDFGLWALSFSALGFFGLFDLGFSNGAIKYVAECSGSGDFERRNRMLSTLAMVYLILSVVALLGTAVLAYFYQPLFSIPDGQVEKALAVLWILAARVAILGLPLSLFRNLLFGEQKIHWINLVQCLTTILLGLATWWVLRAGYGIVAVAWLNLGVFLLEHGLYYLMARRAVAELELAFRLVSFDLFKEIGSFSIYAFASQVAALILLRTDTLIVTFFLPLSAVAVYAVALKVTENLLLLLKQFINVLTPVVAKKWSQGDGDSVRSAFVYATKFAFAAAMMTGVVGWVLGNDGIVLWIGPEFAPAAMVLTILLASMVALMPQIVATMALAMTGEAKFTARAAFLSAGINIAASVALAPFLGLNGIALGTLAATLVVDVCMVLRKACKTYGVTMADYVRNSILPALAPAACQFAVTWQIAAWFPPSNLLILAVEASAGCCAFAVTFWCVGLASAERNSLLRNLLPQRAHSLAPESVP